MVNGEVAPRAVLLDIEGTTTPISFVAETLFPYARRRGREFILRHLSDEEIQAAVAQLRVEQMAESAPGAPAVDSDTEDSTEAAIRYYLWLMDVDRKSTPLKTIQGRIWQEGYEQGELQSAIYPDVAPALRRWHDRGTKVAIYSSGSVLAQQQLFRHTPQGDLTQLIDAYFDTRVGPKKEPESYRRIAGSLELPSRDILFISDVAAELEAAAGADMRTALSVRTSFPVICSFDELL